MISQNLLSPSLNLYLSSHHSKLSEHFNKSQEMKRADTTIKEAFATFYAILDSKEISEKEGDRFFHFEIVEGLIERLTRYRYPNPVLSNENSLRIADAMISYGLAYYLKRFTKARYFHTKISEMKSLVADLANIAREEEKEKIYSALYLARKNIVLPQSVGKDRDHYVAECIFCFHTGLGNDEKEAIRRIQHPKECVFDKNDTDRFIKIFPPTREQIPMTFND